MSAPPGSLYARGFAPAETIPAQLQSKKHGWVFLLKAEVLDNCRVIAYYGSYARRYGGSARQSATATTRRKSLK